MVHDECTLPAKPDNIHARFASKMRGILIYKVFRGARWARRMISPWPDELAPYTSRGSEMEAGYFYCPYIPLMTHTAAVPGVIDAWVDTSYYPVANIHVMWVSAMRKIARKWIPWYPRNAIPGFKTRYDKD